MWGANGIQKNSLLPPWSWNPLRADCRCGRYKKPATVWSRVRKYWGKWNINLFLQRKATNSAPWKNWPPLLENGALCNIDKAKFGQHVAAFKISSRPFWTSPGRDSLQSQVRKWHGAVGAWRQLSEGAETQVKTQSALCLCLPENISWDCLSFLSPAYLTLLFLQAVCPALSDSSNWPY